MPSSSHWKQETHVRVCRHEGMRKHKHNVQKSLATCFTAGRVLFSLVILCRTGSPAPAAAPYYKRSSFHIFLTPEVVNTLKSKCGISEMHVFHTIIQLRSHKPNHHDSRTVCRQIRSALFMPHLSSRRPLICVFHV